MPKGKKGRAQWNKWTCMLLPEMIANCLQLPLPAKKGRVLMDRILVALRKLPVHIHSNV